MNPLLQAPSFPESCVRDTRRYMRYHFVVLRTYVTRYKSTGCKISGAVRLMREVYI
jgi:hypothetical protein